VLTTFMRDLPVEIEEAAIVDGATPWVIITQVFLPLLWPAMVTTGWRGWAAARSARRCSGVNSIMLLF
jgi:trehalose/maltose transport system permease protein